MKLTKQTKIWEIIQKYPRAISILERHKIACKHCHFTRQETLGELAQTKQISFSQLSMELKQLIESMH